MSGYASAEYAQSLAEFGTVRALPACGGWVLERAIAGTGSHDAIGCYPLFACSDWSQLGADIDALGTSLVSVTLVTDSFAATNFDGLARIFPDLTRPYKEHFVADLRVPADKGVDAHHRRNAERGLSGTTIEISERPLGWLDEWCALYEHLVARHSIRGIARFSAESFRQQLLVPGCVAVRAVRPGNAGDDALVRN
jgi:hypothetical protein